MDSTYTVRRMLLAALIAVTTYFMYLTFKPFLGAIAWALVLVVLSYPLYARLERLLGGRGAPAAVMVSLLIGAVIVVPLVLGVLKAGQGAAQAYDWLERNRYDEQRFLESVPWGRDALEWADQYVDVESINLVALGASALRNVGAVLAARGAELVGNAVQTLISLIVLLVTMIVLFQRGPQVLLVVRQLVPLPDAERQAVFAELHAATRAVFFGVIFTAFVQAVLAAIGWAIAGLPTPAMAGAATFFFALLPGGPVLIWAPGALWLFVSGHTGAAIFMALWGALVVSTIDNVLRPLFIQRGVKMHILLVFFGIVGGMLAFGLIGLFTGPLVITLFLFLLGVARREFFREEETPATAEDAGPA